MREYLHDEADDARKAYQHDRCGVSPGYRLPPQWATIRDPTKVWIRLVSLCRHRDIATRRYVRWAVSRRRVQLDAPPEPPDLLQPSRMDDYVTDAAIWREEIRLGLLCQKREAKGKFLIGQSLGHSWRQAALSACFGHLDSISPLFRHLLALEFATVAPSREDADAMRELAADFRESAILQYGNDPDGYDDVYRRDETGVSIPSSFKEHGERLYRAMIHEYDKKVSKERA